MPSSIFSLHAAKWSDKPWQVLLQKKRTTLHAHALNSFFWHPSASPHTLCTPWSTPVVPYPQLIPWLLFLGLICFRVCHGLCCILADIVSSVANMEKTFSLASAASSTSLSFTQSMFLLKLAGWTVNCGLDLPRGSGCSLHGIITPVFLVTEQQQEQQ